jgi:PadR family transcriptional regulator, regulatory protein PadR
MKNEFLENWHSQLRKGLLPLFVLSILNNKECYGYELIQEIKFFFGIDVAEGTLYPLLVRLMKDELLVHKWVEQPSGIPRKYYTVSETGKKNLQEMKGYSISILSKLSS